MNQIFLNFILNKIILESGGSASEFELIRKFLITVSNSEYNSSPGQPSALGSFNQTLLFNRSMIHFDAPRNAFALFSRSISLISLRLVAQYSAVPSQGKETKFYFKKSSVSFIFKNNFNFFQII